MQQLLERRVRVTSDPPVELSIAQTAGDHDGILLVIHGGPDWDHSYLRDPLTALGGERRFSSLIYVDAAGPLGDYRRRRTRRRTRSPI